MDTDTPIHSTFADDPDMMELVEFFVDEISDRVAQLDAAFHSKDSHTLQDLAHQLKGAAGGYGFQVISDAAAKLESPLKGGSPIESVSEELAELVSLCNRVTIEQS